MPGLDWIPGVSQLKSGFQLITLDFKGARQTQENFVKECPVVSQVTSVVQLATGDADGALETQKRCLDTVNNVANGLPVIGHAKGVVHYIAGDTKGGNKAMNAASRSAVVIGSGVLAGITTGGVAAIPVGIAAGAAYDGTATLITDKPQGIIAACKNVIKNPNAGNIFDALSIPVVDAIAGYAGGKLGSEVEVGKLGSDLVADCIDEKIPAKAAVIVKELSASAGPISLLLLPGHHLALQCDAILADDYGIECDGNYTTPALKAQQLGKLHSQSPQGSINKAFTNVVVATKEYIDRLQREKQDPQKTQAKTLYDALSWLAVPMPSQFNYTGAVLRNSPRQGLFHTFLRHSVQWEQVVRGLQTSVNTMSSTMRAELQSIGSATPQNVRSRLNNFQSNVMPQLSENEREVLSGLQMDIHDFLRRNVTYSNYRGETVNQAGLQQVNFEVIDLQGNRQMMVVCVSSQLYPSDDNFNDSRPIRTITTVFFKPINQTINTTKHF